MILRVFHHSFLVNGQGYEKIGNKLDFRITSSLRNPNPSSFIISNPNPIPIQLDPDYLIGSNQFLEVTFPNQLLVST
jgi:hypothetical protein